MIYLDSEIDLQNLVPRIQDRPIATCETGKVNLISKCFELRTTVYQVFDSKAHKVMSIHT